MKKGPLAKMVEARQALEDDVHVRGGGGVSRVLGRRLSVLSAKPPRATYARVDRSRRVALERVPRAIDELALAWLLGGADKFDIVRAARWATRILLTGLQRSNT